LRTLPASSRILGGRSLRHLLVGPLALAVFHVACSTSTSSSSGGAGVGGFGGESTFFSGAITNDGPTTPDGLCLPNRVTETTSGQVASCVVLEGTKASTCTCDPTKARSPVSAQAQPLVQSAQAEPAGMGLTCFCEVTQLCVSGTAGCAEAAGADLTSCRTDPASTENGWCYVDANDGKAEAAVIASIGKCPPKDTQQLRFLGSGAPQPGATFFVTCTGY
jgi:hypothetical protein